MKHLERKDRSVAAKEVEDFLHGTYDIYDYIYIIFGVAFFLGLLAPVCFFLTSYEDLIINTESEYVKDLYDRYNVYTTYISFGNLIYYYCVHLAGWIFIRRVNQRDFRKFNKILQKNNTYECMFWLFVYSTILFFTTGVINLKHKYDLSGYCDEPNYRP